MKRFLALSVVLAFVIAIPLSLQANGDEDKNASQWCKANDDLGYSNHGQCVKLFTACYGPGNTGPVCACKEYLTNDPTGFYQEYNNLGECISHLRHGYVDNN